MTDQWLDADGTERLRGTFVGGAVAVQKTTIPRAAILTLDSVPVTVVTAPGSGKAVIPLGIAVSYQFGTIAYTGGFGMNLNYAGSSPSAQGYAFIPDAFCAETAATFMQQVIDVGAAPLADGRPTAQVEDKALVLGADTGPIADGDGSFVVTVAYATVDIAA